MSLFLDYTHAKYQAYISVARFCIFYKHIYIGIIIKVLGNSPEDPGPIPSQSGTKDSKKWVLDAFLLNTQHCKVWIKV